MKFLDVPQSGSIADRTHSHNRAGQYTRNRRAPVQPVGTGRRAAVRSFFGAASAGWASLATAVQDAFISFAADHPITDALGQSILLTGHQMFVALGVNLQNTGNGLPVAPPSDLTLPDISGVTVTGSHTTGFSVDDFTGATTDFIVVSFSKPMGPGRRFNKTFWQPLALDGVTAADGAPFAIPAAVYTAQFGTMAAGQVVFVKVTPINAQGWAGTPQIKRVVLT